MISDYCKFFFLTRKNRINNKLVELEHFSALLIFENSIICERLEGLHKALESLLGIYSSNNKITDEFSVVIDLVKILNTDFKEVHEKVNKVVREKDEIVNLSKDFLEQRLGLDDKKNKIIKAFKDSKKDLDQALAIEKSTNEKLKIKLVDQEKIISCLNTELSGLKQKCTRFNTSLAVVSEEEKVCVNCRKVYKESENYNWSCRYHMSKYSGVLYWCCGQNDKFVQGCISAKHMIIEPKEKKGESSMQVQPFCSVIFTQSCKKKGHFSTTCPNDPNAKTNFEPEDEKLRIENSANYKQRLSKVIDVEKLDMLIKRSTKSQIPSPLSRSPTDSKVNFFEDLMKIKEELLSLSKS